MKGFAHVWEGRRRRRRRERANSEGGDFGQAGCRQGEIGWDRLGSRPKVSTSIPRAVLPWLSWLVNLEDVVCYCTKGDLAGFCAFRNFAGQP